MEPNEYGHYPWRSQVTVTDPIGARVTVVVTAPTNGLWSPADTRDAAEIAAHAAHEVIGRINKIRSEKAMECPF